MTWGVPRERRYRSELAERDRLQKASYGAGILVGCLAVHWTKKVLRSIPVLNYLTQPLLDLLPTAILGPAIGAAVVYGLSEGDITAARHKVHKALVHANEELDMVARGLRSELSDLRRRQERAVRKLASGQDQSLGEYEKSLMPMLERQYKQAQKQLELLQSDPSWVNLQNSLLFGNQEEGAKPRQASGSESIGSTASCSTPSSPSPLHQQLLLRAAAGGGH